MEEKSKKKQIIIIAVSVIAVIAIIVGATVAYFSARDQSEEKTVTTGSVGIKYTDNIDKVTIDNIIPIYDNEIETKANKFSFNLENLGNATTYVDITLTDIVMDDALKDLEFKWALYSGDEEINNGNFRNVTNNEMLLAKNIAFSASQNKDYALYIWISENDLDQSDMMGARLTAKITVEGNQSKGADLLSTVIKNNNPLQVGTPDFSKAAVSQEYYNTLTESTELKKSNAVVETGLYQGIDDDGETYYFRGGVENNYVKIDGLTWPNDNEKYVIHSFAWVDTAEFETLEEAQNACSSDDFFGSTIVYEYLGYSNAQECIDNAIDRVGHVVEEDMLWKIIRINGDGTIRLVADGSIGNEEFNENITPEKYAGYTYDNSSPNVQDGTPSIIKTYLENWYNENLIEYDSLIANTRYCNDTSNSVIYENYYGAYDRLENNNPQFICPNTDKTYGGEYDLKIGLITADEVAFAGVTDIPIFNTNQYLANGTDYFTSTPNLKNDGFYAPGRSGTMSGYMAGDGIDNVPVINLKSDVLYTSGNGTESNPYVITVN